MEARLRPLPRRLGRRRDAGARRHRRSGASISRPSAPARQSEVAPGVGESSPRRCHRAARLERHPRQRAEPRAQAGRAAAAGLPDGVARRADGYGDALLAPTPLYSPVTEALFEPASCRTTAPTSPATAGASCCAIPRLAYRITHRARGPAGAEFIQPGPGTTARPTARSTWAPASHVRRAEHAPRPSRSARAQGVEALVAGTSRPGRRAGHRTAGHRIGNRGRSSCALRQATRAEDLC